MIPPNDATSGGPPDDAISGGPPDDATSCGPPDDATSGGPPDATVRTLDELSSALHLYKQRIEAASGDSIKRLRVDTIYIPEPLSNPR